MRRRNLRHVVIGVPNHPDCPLCQLEADAGANDASEDHAASIATHPADCPCRFCAPTISPFAIAPLAPMEDEVIDIAVGQADGSLKISGSYRVERDGSMTWLTPDGRPPKHMLSRGSCLSTAGR